MIGAETILEQYGRLLTALSEGWTVEPPVYARPAWSSRERVCQMYHFVLRRSGELSLLSVQDNLVIREFITRQRWAINQLDGEFESKVDESLTA